MSFCWQEIVKAVERFSELLTTDDQCAVLAILAHGMEGVVTGSDGGQIPIRDIIQQLDNVNCVQMATKPKVILIQACQGGKCLITLLLY